MSFYLGSGASGIKQLHITKGVTPLTDMVQGAFSATVFHSDLPYVVAKHTADCSVTTGSGIVQGFALSLDTTTKNLLVDGYLFFTLLKTAASPNEWVVYSPAPYWKATGTNQWFNEYSSCFSESTTATLSNSSNWPTSNSNWFLVSATLGYESSSWFPLEVIEAKIVVLNIRNGTYEPVNSTGTGIVLTRDEFTVGGKKLNEVQYLADGLVNTLDTTFLSRGVLLQLVNSTPVNGAFSLTCSGGDTVISYGNKPVFSTEASNVKSVYDKLVTFNTPGGIFTAPNTLTDLFIDITPAGTYSEGVLLIFGMNGVTPDMSGSYSISRFKQGLIAPVGVRVEERYNSGLLISRLIEIVDLVGTVDGKLQVRYTASSSTSLGGDITSAPWDGWIHSFKGT